MIDEIKKLITQANKHRESAIQMRIYNCGTIDSREIEIHIVHTENQIWFLRQCLYFLEKDKAEFKRIYNTKEFYSRVSKYDNGSPIFETEVIKGRDILDVKT